MTTNYIIHILMAMTYLREIKYKQDKQIPLLHLFHLLLSQLYLSSSTILLSPTFCFLYCPLIPPSLKTHTTIYRLQCSNIHYLPTFCFLYFPLIPPSPEKYTTISRLKCFTIYYLNPPHTLYSPSFFHISNSTKNCKHSRLHNSINLWRSSVMRFPHVILCLL